MKPMRFSDKVEEMEKKLEPYFLPTGGGVREDSPEEIKKLFEEYKKKVLEEMWFD